MSTECSNDCTTCSESSSEKADEPVNFSAKANELSHVKKVIAVVSGKGGVGKSLVTSLLAVLARRAGYKTAVLDADITGPSIPKAFGLKQRAEGSEAGLFPVRTKTGIEVMSLNLLLDNDTDPVVWRGPLIAGTVKQFWSEVVWGDIDFMFVDMPPGTGDVPLTVFQSLPVDGVVVVASPQELVGMIVEKAVRMAGMMKIPVLGFVENMSYMVCPDCGKKLTPFGESRADVIAEKHDIPSVARLPIDTRLATACDRGVIELFEGNWLDGLFGNLEKALSRSNLYISR
jgi:Mrp family chromosome partitioning ATPase